MSQRPTLPSAARLPINRCNLPAVILGSLAFQQHPTDLLIDGVAELHADLFRRLERTHSADERAHVFMDYMVVHFCLGSPEEAGLTPEVRLRRDKADYLRVVRGWFFDPDGREAAVLKGWVESRFGLVPRYHNHAIHDPSDHSYRAYLEARATGLYNTNALEAQLDLLYTYCQYELRQGHPERWHLRLYRGVNRPDEHEVLQSEKKSRTVVVLNNLNSFTERRERADEFGDYIMEVDVPLSKIFFYNRLLPGMLKGEEEFVVIGGLYEVRLSTL